MAIVLVEGITDRLAVEAVAQRLGIDLDGVEIVPIGGAQAIRRAAAEYEGERLVGLCDRNEERFFRRVLPDATFVCVKDLEDELIRAVGVPRVEELVAAQGELATFRKFQNQPAWRGRSAGEGLPRWLRSADRRRYRYLSLLVELLEPDEIPQPLAGVLRAVA
jgi:Overcoming lysogenization defect protein-like, TOPRIM domain